MISLFSGGLATALLKILEKFLNKAKDESSAELELRSELRIDMDRKIEELAVLREKHKALGVESDKWRTWYWLLFEVFFQVKLMGQVMAQTNPELKEHLDSVTAPHERNLEERYPKDS